MSLPKRVKIREVGPREGFQFEKQVFETQMKGKLISSLSKTGLKEIEVCSFVRNDIVPQMADADQLAEQLQRVPEVSYRAIYLNLKGFERALATKNINEEYALTITASETFSKKNTNSSLENAFHKQEERLIRFKELGINSVQLEISAAFGCNYEGDIPLTKLLNILNRLENLAHQYDMNIDRIRLMDTMGWANPKQMTETIEAVKKKWPEPALGLHLHDTRGLGLINAYAALCCGIDEFDAAIGGMGGCPFSKSKGAAGNIATEDFVFLCEELGIETGLDLEKVIESAILAEEILGHSLPGKVKAGGKLVHAL